MVVAKVEQPELIAPCGGIGFKRNVTKSSKRLQHHDCASSLGGLLVYGVVPGCSLANDSIRVGGGFRPANPVPKFQNRENAGVVECEETFTTETFRETKYHRRVLGPVGYLDEECPRATP